MLQFLFMDNRYIFAYASNFISIHSFNKVLTNFSNSRTFFTVPVTWNNLKTFVCQCTSTIVQSGYVHGWGGGWFRTHRPIKASRGQSREDFKGLGILCMS